VVEKLTVTIKVPLFSYLLTCGLVPKHIRLESPEQEPNTPLRQSQEPHITQSISGYATPWPVSPPPHSALQVNPEMVAFGSNPFFLQELLTPAGDHVTNSQIYETFMAATGRAIKDPSAPVIFLDLDTLIRRHPKRYCPRTTVY
jgi:hypothetical protein